MENNLLESVRVLIRVVLNDCFDIGFSNGIIFVIEYFYERLIVKDDSFYKFGFKV